MLASQDIKLRFREEILSFEQRKKGGFSVTMIRDSAAFDMVIICIGVAPRKAIAAGAGLATKVGILVDSHLQTSGLGIFAAGDVAEHANDHITNLWRAAEYQGRIAPLNAFGQTTPFDNLPFRLKCSVFDSCFFSINKPHASLDCDIEEQEINNRYQCFYYTDGTVVGAVMVNDEER